MRLSDTLAVATSSLLRTKGRAAMTMLGIVIGIASVILMLSIGRAAQSFLLSQVAAFGSDIVIVTNGAGDVKRGDPASQQLEKQTLTIRDYNRLKDQTWVRAINTNLVSQDLIEYGSESRLTSVYGSAPGEIEVYPNEVKSGRFIDDSDMASRARVAVLGNGIARRLFGETEPVGNSVKIGKRTFRVVGVMPSCGTRFFTDLDQIVYIPITSAFDLYNRDKANFIMFKPREGMTLDEATDRLRLLFRDTHNLENPNGDLAKDDFRVLTQKDAEANANTIGLILQILLASIAAISLIVGGIGIMNIMYVTVTERTAEIGLRKSLGAKPQDVRNQFLMEAIVLTGAGGIIGILSGIATTWIAIVIISRFQTGWVFQVPIDGVLLGVGVSALIGITFGYFPARKASFLDPIEALRYE
jgi:ABC-type antimicrobial peptide transport system permease subunit